jgi:hypothetical protein
MLCRPDPVVLQPCHPDSITPYGAVTKQDHCSWLEKCWHQYHKAASPHLSSKPCSCGHEVPQRALEKYQQPIPSDAQAFQKHAQQLPSSKVNADYLNNDLSQAADPTSSADARAGHRAGTIMQQKRCWNQLRMMYLCAKQPTCRTWQVISSMLHAALTEPGADCSCAHQDIEQFAAAAPT